jgi:Domain of unknown function (DUF4387)
MTPAATTAEGLERIRRNFRLIRSKDAGPFMLTIDLFFADAAVYEAFRASRVLDKRVVAKLYRVRPEEVETYDMAEIYAMKISFPRAIVSGDFGDTDITGGQQYAVLVDYLADLAYGPDGLPRSVDTTGSSR